MHQDHGAADNGVECSGAAQVDTADYEDDEGVGEEAPDGDAQGRMYLPNVATEDERFVPGERPGKA